MSVHTAEPNDLYIDEHGKLWRVVSVCHEPSVTVEEVDPGRLAVKERKGGGVSGLMWNGFRKLVPEPPA